MLWSCLIVSSLFLSDAGVYLRAQEPTSTDPLESLEFLIGEWEGNADGASGQSAVHLEFRRILSKRYINIEGHEVRPAGAGPQNLAIHDDLGILSFDTTRQRMVLRQFHSEGFVVQYTAAPTADKNRIVFLSEAIESLPTGSQVRETFLLVTADELERTLEQADPGKEFRVLSRARLKKAG